MVLSFLDSVSFNYKYHQQFKPGEMAAQMCRGSTVTSRNGRSKGVEFRLQFIHLSLLLLSKSSCRGTLISGFTV